jgi:acetyltransferase
MLGEFRNLPAVHRGALREVLLRVSEIACEIPEVDELDINPLVADERGAIALDARVVLRAVPVPRERYAHLAIHPYPTDLVSTLVVDGVELVLRPIRPEDAQLELEFVEAMSPESRRMRFQSGLRTLSPAMLARFTQIDYDREMALVATIGTGEEERQVAVARYVALADAQSCEYAVVVADDWHGRGLGRVMMERIIAVARRAGLRTMSGWVVTGNTGMLRLCRKLGFNECAVPGDPQTRCVELEL